VLEPADVQSLLSMAALPWSFKPIYGLISDSFPIRRQRRKPYLVAAAVLGVGAWVGLSWLANDSVGGKATPLLLGLLLLSNLSTALSDVIVDAMVAERAAAAARHATLDGADASAGTEGENALQALCWGSLAVGGLAGSGLGMVAASSVSVSRVFLLTAACPLLVLLASRALSETPLPVGKAGSSGLSALRHQLSLLAAALRSPSIFKPLLFFLAQSAIVPDLSQAFFFFSTDVLLFTKEFIALQSILGFAFLLVGSVVYTRFVEGVGFVNLFLGCQLAAAALSLLDVLLVSRVSASLGVPDHVFVLGSDALGTVLNRLMMQPFLVIAARLCPTGVEATLYACFMSTFNFGSTLSGALGALLMPAFGVEKGTYDGFVALLLVRSTLMLAPVLLVKPLLGGVEQIKAA